MVALGVALVIAALYVGREILVPIALAILLSFALTPPMMWLRHRRVGRALSAGIVLAVAFVVILGIGRMMVGQISELAENLPNYQQNLLDKIHFVQGVGGNAGGVFGKTAQMLHNLGQELQGRPDSNAPAAVKKNNAIRNGVLDTSKPIPVEIERAAPAPLEVLESVVGPLLVPLSTIGIIILYAVSFLLQRENLRDRIIRLLGARDLHRTTEALNDAAERVSRYLLFQLMVNAVYAVPICIGLTLIGVPNALLWSLLVVIVRFLPYIGIVIAAIFPLALSIAVAPGWDMFIWTAALFVTIEMVSANLIEPWLYGTKTGLSPVAILVAATFWTWLWGPVGLLLSTPLTVCLVVLGRHVPQLFFLHVMLGNDAPLAREESLYQRLLADDPAEVVSHCEAFIKEHPLTEFYDRVVIPALVLAERDNDRGVLNRKLRMRIRNGIAELIEYFAALDLSEVFTPDTPPAHSQS